MKKLVMVDCVSQFRIRYAVEVEDDIDHALDEIIMRENDEKFCEFSQEHLGMNTVSHREITEEEYLRMFEQDNDYLSSWNKEQKLNFINKIDYSK